MEEALRTFSFPQKKFTQKFLSIDLALEITREKFLLSTSNSDFSHS